MRKEKTSKSMLIKAAQYALYCALPLLAVATLMTYAAGLGDYFRLSSYAFMFTALTAFCVGSEASLTDSHEA